LSDFHKLTVIGLDGGTWDALDRFIGRGYMPFLAELKERSSYGILNSTILPFTMPAWTTFFTGRTPGNHGIMSFWRHAPDGYNLDNVGEFVNATILGPANLWNLLSNAGRKLIVIDVPLTYPPQPINGVMITGLLTPPGAENMTYPPELKDELDDYRIDLDIRTGDRFSPDSTMDPMTMLPDLIDLVVRRKVNALNLMKKYPHDFFMIVFTSTDRLCHFFWDLITDNDQMLSSKYSASDIAGLRDQLISYCKTLDDAIRDLVAAAGQDSNVVMMSDHGFGSSPSRLFNVNCWLRQQSLLVEKTNGQDMLNPLSWIIRFGKSKWIRSITPSSIQAKFKSKVKGNFEELIDWHRTTAYYEPLYMNIGGISINAEGIKREGIVPPNQIESTLSAITAQLLSIRDNDLGQNVIERVARREELFPGKNSQAFPDLIFFARPEYHCSNSLVEMQVVREHSTSGRPGDHRREGIFLASGPDFRAAIKNGIYDIVDIAPTFLYLLDVPLLDTFDGRIIESVLSDSLLSQRTPKVESYQDSEYDQKHSFDEAEDKALRERLKNLGYL
jgi:predicted AlkP superfamily phosphohydrolase/phosphomutase